MARRLNLNHFASRANEAAFWEAWVGAVLARCGLYTLHHPFTVANGLGEVHLYGHSWDLDVTDAIPEGFMWQELARPVEVKSLALTFTCPDDYPYEEVMVCSEASHKRKFAQCEQAGRDFLLVSRVTGSILWVPKGTPTAVKMASDRDRGETYKVVYCRKESLCALKGFVQTFSG